MGQQLSFDLPCRNALGREDFFVSAANGTAVAMVENWADWPARKLMLIGPQGAGKTHLAHVWAALTGAQVIPAPTLAEGDIPALATRAVAVEDCDCIAGDAMFEKALFHLHNLVLAEGHHLLLTAATAPATWPLAIADLKSRLEGTASVHIGAPDDTLLGAVMMKLFADRQLAPPPATLAYLIKRMDRSFEAAHQVVAALDKASLERHRAITPRLAADVLDKLTP